MVTANIASLERNTSSLGDLLLRLSEGQEIAWSPLEDREPMVRIIDDNGARDENEVRADHRLGRKPSTERRVPPLQRFRPLERHPKNHHAFTDKRLDVANRLWSIVRSKALQSGLHVDGEIGGEEESEGSGSQTILVVHVSGNSSQAFALWKSLDIDVDRWLGRLPIYDRDVLLKNVALRFSWSE